jgi:hypothetical protein
MDCLDRLGEAGKSKADGGIVSAAHPLRMKVISFVCWFVLIYALLIAPPLAIWIVIAFQQGDFTRFTCEEPGDQVHTILDCTSGC